MRRSACFATDFGEAASYIVASTVLGLGAVGLGVALARLALRA